MLTKIDHEGFEYEVEEVDIDTIPEGEAFLWLSLTDQSPADCIHRYVDRFGYMPERFYYLRRPTVSFLLLGPVHGIPENPPIALGDLDKWEDYADTRV